MAELGPEGLDDFQDRIDELGDYLFTTLTNSVETAAQSVSLGGISKSLTSELTKGLNNVQVDKILNDKLLKDTKVQKIMTDVQKKFEDGVGKINFKINNIELPAKPLFVNVKANKFDTTGLASELQVPVVFDYEKLSLPNPSTVEVPVEFLYDKFQLPKANPINVAVKYAYDKFTQPKVNKVLVPVSYDYDRLVLPKNQSIDVSVGYDYTPFRLPVTEKDKSINIAVDYIFSKFNLPKTSSINIPVNYIYDKFTLPKQDSLSVFVEYEYDELVLPKQSVSVPVTYDYEKFTLPTFKPIDIFVNYITNKLTTPKVDNIKVPVNYVYDSFKMPKINKLEVPVTYSYDKLTLPKTQGIDVLVDYVYSKLQLPKNQELSVNVGYEYDAFTLPKITELEIPVSYAYDKFNLPKANAISVPVKYLYDKFLLPKLQNLTVPVNYSYSKLQLPTKQSINVSVSYDYEALKLPKPSMDVAVKFAYDKLMLPKVDALQVGVKYSYDKLNIPKPSNIRVGVSYVYDKFVEPIAKAIKVPVKYIYDKFTQPIADTLTIPTEYEYDDLELPAVEELKIPVRYFYDKFQLPKTSSVDIFVDYVYSKLQLPKVSKLLIPVEYKYSKLAEQKEQTLKVQVQYKYDKFITPAVKAISIPVKYLYDKFIQPKVAPLIVKVAPDTTSLKNIPKISVTAEVTSFNTDLIQQTANSLKPIAVNTTAPLDTFTNLTTSIGNAGDAAATLVTILGQVAGKATVSLEAFNKLKEAAYQLVDASRMTRSEVDTMLSDLQSRVPEMNVSARINTLDTSIIDEVTPSPITIPSTVEAPTTPTPTTAPAAAGGDNDLVSSLTQATRQKQQLLQVSNQLLNTNAITQKQYDAMVAAANAQYDAAVDLYNTNSSLISRHKENKKEIGEALHLSNLLNSYANESYDSLRERQLAQRELNKLSNEELRTIASQYPIQQSQLQLFDQQKLSANELKKLILEKIVAEQQRVGILDDLNSAQNDYNSALRQADADNIIKQATVQLNLSEQQTSELAYQMMKVNELNGLGLKLTEQDKQKLIDLNKALRHRREEVELIEHVANYQKEVNEELEEFTSKWTKFKATLQAIMQSPAFAKAALFASSAVMLERLTHSVHDFKEAGMDAGAAVRATFKGLTFNSLLGLSDTTGVLKSITQQYGTLNALTRNQVDAVGKMAKSNGLAAEETTDMVMAISRMPGQTRETASNSEAMFKSIAKTKGVIPAQVMKEVAKNSSLMATYSKGGAEGFIRAAASAKKMGIELSNMLSAARKTLDFESSINAEMEASVLLGRSLNMDGLRRAALSGDAEAIQREQIKLMQQAGGLDNMNVLQKEKLAEMMGLSVDEMQKINDAAKYQEEHFGEQASTWDKITGYMGDAVKYGEGILGGFTQMAPAITAIASIMSIMKTTSLPGILSSVGGMVKGLAAGVFQAGLLLIKWIAMGVVKFWGMLKNLPSTISSAAAAAKGFSFKGAVDGLKEMGGKLKDFIKQASSGKVKEAFSGMFSSKATGLPADKAKDMAKRVSEMKAKTPGMTSKQAYEKIKGESADKAAEVSDKAKQASDKTKTVQPGTGIKQFFKNLAEGLKAMGQDGVGKGVFNTMVAGPALLIAVPAIPFLLFMGKAELNKLAKNFTNLANGLTAMGVAGRQGIFNLALAGPALVLALGAIPFLFTFNKMDTSKLPKNFTNLATGLNAMSGGIAGVGVLAAFGVAAIIALPSLLFLGGLALIGKGIQIGLKALGEGLKALGKVGAEALIGIGIIALFGVALIPLTYALSLLTPLVEAFGKIIIGVFQALPPIIDAVANAFVTIFQVLADNWQILIPAGIGMGVLGAGMIALGTGALIAIPGIFAFAAAMKFAGPAITQLASVVGDILIKAMEKLPAIIDSIVNGFTTIFNTLAQNYQILIPVGIGLGTMAIGLAALGAAAFVALPGLVVLSFMLPLIASGAQQLAVGMQGVVSSLTTLSNLKADNFNAIGNGLLKIAKGLGAVALSGLAAVPVLAALSALGMASPPTAEMPKAAESKSAAPAVKATQPAAPAIQPAAASTATAQQTQQTTTTKSTKESSADISILVDKLNELIGVIKAGGSINIDGRKLANIVMSNIKSTKFTD